MAAVAVKYKKSNPGLGFFLSFLSVFHLSFIVGIAFIIGLVSGIPPLIPALLFVGFFLLFFFYKDDLQKYHLPIVGKSYYLLPQSRSGRSLPSENYLEDFVKDFSNLDWTDRDSVVEYKQVFRLIKAEKFPNGGSDKRQSEELVKNHQKALREIQDDMALKSYLSQLYDYLKKYLKTPSVVQDDLHTVSEDSHPAEPSSQSANAHQFSGMPVDFRMANQYGIAGFVFSLTLPIQKLLFDLVLPLNPSSGTNFLHLVIFFSAIIALILSIIGISQNKQKYQHGLATWGLIFNVIFMIRLTFEFMNGFQ